MQLTQSYGAYSNAHRGNKAKSRTTCPGGATTEPEEDAWIKARRKSWARLVQRVFEVDPLLCKCGSRFEIISIIEARAQPDVVGKILACTEFVFEVPWLPARPPPFPFGSPEPDPGPRDSYHMESKAPPRLSPR